MHCLLDTNEEKRDGLIRELQQGTDYIWIPMRESYRIPKPKVMENSLDCHCSKTRHLLLLQDPSAQCNTPLASLAVAPL